MPKYYFRAIMCTTFILECGKNTTFSEIKTLFANELNIEQSRISLMFMPTREMLRDNDKICSLKPIEGSFIAISFKGEVDFPSTTKNKSIKIISPGKPHKFGYEYGKRSELRVKDRNEYTISSDLYHTHLRKRFRFNYTTDTLLEQKAEENKNNFNQSPHKLPKDFIFNLVNFYKENKLEEFQKLINNDDLKNDIEKETKNKHFIYDRYDDLLDVLPGKHSRNFDENDPDFYQLIEYVRKDSPEAADLLKSQYS